MILGHSRNIQYLERVLIRGTLAHAYIFHGPEAVGKKTVALELAKALLCRADKAGSERSSLLPGKDGGLGGCGRCGDCRRIDTLSHPDLILLSSERLLVEEDLKREIGIKNIRELRRLLGLSAWGGGWKVAIIDGAEHLSRDAQSALLKILEEPGVRTLFILVTDAPGALFPTIRSRAVPLSFTTVSDSELEPIMTNAPASRRREILRLAEGRPGLAVRLASDADFFKVRSDDVSQFERLLNADLPEQFSFSDGEGREPGRLEAFLEYLLHRLRSDFHASLGKAAFDSKRIAGTISRALASASLIASVPVNRRLAADRLFWSLATLRREGV